jgi:hypothetical protein
VLLVGLQVGGLLGAFLAVPIAGTIKGTIEAVYRELGTGFGQELRTLKADPTNIPQSEILKEVSIPPQDKLI